jgi:ketosteroid isomerase-like protein
MRSQVSAGDPAPDGGPMMHDDRDRLHSEVAAQIATWLEAWGSEVAAVDLRAARERFAPGLLAFGTHADVVEGRDEVEAQQWSQIWPAIEDFAFDVAHLHVLASPDGLLAVAIVPWTSTGIDEHGARFDRPGRATVVLERPTQDDAWVASHTHFSLARGVPSSTHGHREAIR